jgi:hypothetical protein
LNLLLREQRVRQFFGGGGLFGGGRSSQPAPPFDRQEALTRQNIEDTKKDGEKFVKEITKFADSLQSQVRDLGKDLQAGLNNEERIAIDRVLQINSWLNSETDKNLDTFASDINKALTELESAARTLDLGERKEITAKIDSYKKEATRLDNQLRSETTSAVDKSEASATAALGDFRDESLGLADRFVQAGQGFRSDSDALTEEGKREREKFDQTTESLSKEARADAERFRSDSMAEGDKFIGRIEDYKTDSTALADRYLKAGDSAMAEFNRLFDLAGDLSPERLDLFTKAAEYLTQANIQTRMNAINTADPRALELSAIADNNAAAMMSGQISADMQANLARSSAMRALSGGFGAGSEMGRGLTARDLGLTSLDLRQQGFQDYEAQRRLNYDTRINGTQVDSSGLLANDQDLLRARAQTGLDGSLRIAGSDLDARRGALDNSLRGFETDRIQRQSAFDSVLRSADADILRRQNAATTGLDAFSTDARRQQGALDSLLRAAESDRDQRQGVADRTFGSRVVMADTRRAEDINTARALYASQSGRGRDVLGMEIGTLVDFNNRERGRQDLRFNTNTGLAKDIFGTRQGNTGSIYGTAINAATSFYNTGVIGQGNIFGQNVNAAGSATNLKAGAESQRLANLTQARTRATATLMELEDRRYQHAMNEWAKPQGWFENMVQGASIGMSEGSAFGPWGAAGGAIFGGIDGAAGGPIYNAKTRNGYDYSSSGGGMNMFAGMGGMSSMGMFGSNMGGSGMTGGQMKSSTIPGTTGSYQSWAGGYVPKATLA